MINVPTNPPTTDLAAQVAELQESVGAAIADIAAVHAHVHSLPTSFSVTNIASVQRGWGTVLNTNPIPEIILSPVNTSKTMVNAWAIWSGGGTIAPFSITPKLTSSTTLILSHTSSGDGSIMSYSWEVITYV